MEEAAGEKLELSRELASMRARLSVLTLQAQQKEKKAPAAERPSADAERAEQHAAALKAAQQEISALNEQLARAEASTAWRNSCMHAHWSHLCSKPSQQIAHICPVQALHADAASGCMSPIIGAH